MPGADIYLCYARAGSTAIVVQDMYAVALGLPLLDSNNDLVLSESGRLNGVTWCVFSRPLTTCWPSEDIQITDPTITLSGLLAFGPSDALEYHGPDDRQAEEFSFVMPLSIALPSDAQTVMFTAPVAPVPVVSSQYACSYHDLGLLLDPNTKVHIVAYTLTRGSSINEGVLHHVNLNACDQPVSGYSDGQLGDCGVLMAQCSRILLNGGYTPGGTTLDANSGIPILGPSSPRYAVISRHFYNPALKSGVSDSGTSYSIVVTKMLRPNELFTITLGITEIDVPPMSSRYVVPAYCDPQCTARLGAVNVTNVNFHMHAHGAAARVRVIRGNVELAPLAVIDPFNQGVTGINIAREILPNDALLFECLYNNDLNTNLTFGSNLNQEMCFAFLTVIGSSTSLGFSSCIDLPSGVAPYVPASAQQACALCPKGVPYVGILAACAQCDFTSSFSYCPPINNVSSTIVGYVNAQDRAMPFTAYVPPTMSCANVTTATVITSPAIAGTCDGVTQPILGAVMIPSLQMLQVSWATDCVAQTVTFVIAGYSGYASEESWLGVGLQPGGTADNITAPPLTRMKGLDIVQMSDSYLLDRLGYDYTLPNNKTVSVATFVNSTVTFGALTRTFVRPFVSPSGLTLVPEEFVYVAAAVGHGADLDVQHDFALLLTTRVSLFGGTAESTKEVSIGVGNNDMPTQPSTQQPLTNANGVPVSTTANAMSSSPIASVNNNNNNNNNVHGSASTLSVLTSTVLSVIAVSLTL